MKNAIAFSAAAMMFAIAAPAHATGVIKCDAGPQSGWKSPAVLTAKLTKEGWQVRKAKVDGGCYEVYGTMPKGERVEAYFHPVTLENLFIGQRGKVIFRKAGY
jgi:hypothetical protein